MCRQFICLIRDEARLFVVTGAPVQPHSSVGLSGLGAHYRWILIPELIHKHVGLPVNACSPREFCNFFDVPDPSAPQDSHTCSVRALVCMCRHMHSIQVVLHIPVSIALFSLRLPDRAHKARSVPRCCIVVHIPMFTITCAVRVKRGQRRRGRHTTADAGVHPVERRAHPRAAGHGNGPASPT